jgi:hypothetical protein
LALVALTGWLMTGFQGSWLFAALVFGLLLLPVSAIYKCQPGWPRTTMVFYTLGMALVGLGAVAMLFANSQQPAGGESLIRETTETLLGLFVFGAIGSTWVANLLIVQRRRR